MNINITLTEEQKESIKQSVFSTMSPKEMANQLFITISMARIEAPELRKALMDFLQEDSK